MQLPDLNRSQFRPSSFLETLNLVRPPANLLVDEVACSLGDCSLQWRPFRVDFSSGGGPNCSIDYSLQIGLAA